MVRSPRLRIVSILVIIVGLVFIAKLFWVQVVYGDEYHAQADRQYVSVTDSEMERGAIYFTRKNGDLVAAASVEVGHKVAIIPKDIPDPHEAYNQLAQVLELDPVSFIRKASKRNDPYEEIVHQLDDDTAAAVRELDLPYARVFQDTWRTYPGGSLAAQVVGFLAYDGDIRKGQYGLERSYDDFLARAGGDLYVNFFAEVFSEINSRISNERPEGGSIITTIEPSVQLNLERILEDLHTSWGSRVTGGIVMDPVTGAVYGMGAVPNFDVNEFSEVDSPAVYVNPLVENIYEPGSIMKPLVMAMGLDLGVISPDTPFYDKGKVTIGDYDIYNFDQKGRGQVVLQDVLTQSLNTGMVFVGQKVGRGNMRAYFKRYGFGVKTGIDLPNESNGLTSNMESNREVEFANMSFGQGIAISPIAMARALSVLANGGVSVQPHVVQRLKYHNEFLEKKVDPTGHEAKRVIQETTSEEISRMLVGAYDAYYNGEVQIEGYSVAAKTGTAQLPDTELGGYLEDENLHSFFGYFPAYEPRFLVYLFTERPQGAKYASETLTAPFEELARYLLNYYDVEPDREYDLDA